VTFPVFVVVQLKHLERVWVWQDSTGWVRRGAVQMGSQEGLDGLAKLPHCSVVRCSCTASVASNVRCLRPSGATAEAPALDMHRGGLSGTRWYVADAALAPSGGHQRRSVAAVAVPLASVWVLRRLHKHMFHSCTWLHQRNSFTSEPLSRGLLTLSRIFGWPGQFRRGATLS